MYKGDYSSPNLVSAPVITTTARKEINEEMLQTIVSGAKGTDEGNSIAYIMNLDDKLPVVPPTHNTDDNNDNTNTNTNTNTNNQVLADGGSSKPSSTSSSNSGRSLPSSNGAASTVGRSIYPIASYAASTAVASAEVSNEEASEDSPSDSSSNGNSYEITQKDESNGISANSIVLAIAAVLILGAILGVGYVKFKKD